MGLKKTHEHESGFFEENILTANDSSRNRCKLVAEEKMRSVQQMRDSGRGQAQINLIDNCNNVSDKYEKLKTKIANYNKYEKTQTIVIDSDDDDDDDDGDGGDGGDNTSANGDDNQFVERVVVSTVTNGHCSSNPDPDIVDVADDSDDGDEMLESIDVHIGDDNIDDSADEDVDIDGTSHTVRESQPQPKHHHHPQLQHHQHISQQSKSSNNSSNNNRAQEKSKNGDTDAKSSAQLMREIEEASTIRSQGEFNYIKL